MGLYYLLLGQCTRENSCFDVLSVRNNTKPPKLHFLAYECVEHCSRVQSFLIVFLIKWNENGSKLKDQNSTLNNKTPGIVRWCLNNAKTYACLHRNWKMKRSELEEETTNKNFVSIQITARNDSKWITKEWGTFY